MINNTSTTKKFHGQDNNHQALQKAMRSERNLRDIFYNSKSNLKVLHSRNAVQRQIIKKWKINDSCTLNVMPHKCEEAQGGIRHDNY